MKTDIVTTNLRLPREDWLQVKTDAAEDGISFNEYIKNMIWECGTGRSLGVRHQPQKRNKSQKPKLTIWDLPKLAKIKDKPMGMSKEDKIIYE